MARSTATIKQNIMNAIAADAILGPLLTSTSLTSIFGLFAYIIAACQNLLEQVWDQYLLQLETYAAQTPAGAPNWVASQAFLYQYDPSGSPATNDLTILSNGALGYATIDPAFNIVTRCAVITDGMNVVNIKVAQSNPPAPITGAAFTQLDSYFTAKLTAGISHQLISDVSDKIAIYGTVYYKPGFGGVAQANVEAALNAYLNNIAIFSRDSQTPVNYEGVIKVSEIIVAIKQSEGIDDFKLDTIKCRADATSFGSATVVYDLATGTDNRSYIMVAGYGVEETTAGQDWGTTLLYASA